MLVDKVMKLRGWNQEDRVISDPNYCQFHDPFLMKGMALAVKRIIEAIKAKEQITIYGDYDCDGIGGTALLVDSLNKLGAKVNYCIPSRLVDGYGLSEDLLDKVIKEGSELIITVDCGVTGKTQVEHVKSKGVGIIVIDHHLPDEKRFPDCIVVNPKQEGCNYPFKELCGCAVAFKVVTSLVKTLEAPTLMLAELIDIVTLATIADVVPLVGENRSLVKYGLKRIRNGQIRVGIQQLISNTTVDRTKISSYDIGFKITPQINAIGRLSSAERAVRLLLTTDFEETKLLANTLTALNTSRQELQADQLNAAISLVEEGASVNLIYLDEAHEGIIGIIAGRIRELTMRPTFIFTGAENGLIKSSARSVENIQLYNEVVYSGADLICESFGGHGGSCGLSVLPENFEELKRRLVSAFDKFSDEDFRKTKFPPIEITLDEITLDNINSLKMLEPYGKDNPQPQFKIVTDGIVELRVLGKGKDTGKIQLSFTNKVDIMIFKSEESYLKSYFADTTCAYEFTGTLGINTYMDKTTCQLIAKEYKKGAVL